MKYVILSSKLSADAKGHYLPFHKTLYDGFVKQGLEVIYLGGKASPGSELWFRPVLSKGLNKPLPWAIFSSFSKEIDQATGDKNFSLIVFEGDLATTFLVARYLIANRKGVAVVNQFRGDKLAKKFTSKLERAVYSKIYDLLTRMTQHRLVLSSDNENFRLILSRNLTDPVMNFQMFSALARHDSEISYGNKTLILVRGTDATNLVLEALQKRARDKKYVIHGIPRDKLEERGNVEGVEFSRGDLTQTEYRNSYLEFEAVVIVYSPKDFAYVSSGRIYDALCMRVPVFAPKETSMATELDEEFTFNFNSVDELGRVLNVESAWLNSLSSRELEKFRVANTISGLVTVSDCAKKSKNSLQRVRFHSFQKLSLKFLWDLYGIFTFLLARGFFKPRIFLDSVKMKVRLIFQK